MAAIRAVFLVFALVGFFLIGAPLQWLVARLMPRAAHVIPLVFCRSLLRLLKVRVVVEGARVTDRPVITAANHVSWIDILALGGLMPFCFLAKSEVAAWPILSAFAEVQGTIFVDRKRRRSIPAANRQMAARLREGRTVLLFPEGTTIGTPETAPFKSSHFAAARDYLDRDGAREVSIQPVAVAYSSPSAAWVGDDDLLSHLWQTLRAPPLICRLAFAAPIPYRAETDRKAVARGAREAIVALIRSQPAGGERRVEAATEPQRRPDLAATEC